MIDEAEAMEPLASRSNDGPKSAIRARPDRGLEVRVRPVRRRIWPDEDKLRIVRETLDAGAVVQVVADRNGVSTGQLYTWRKEMLAAAVTGFVPVVVAPEMPRVEAPARQRSSVPTLTPTSRETTSMAALSGGGSRATMRSLNVCPYRATA